MPNKIPDPYDRTTFRGRPLDYATAAACVAVELELGYRLTIMQGIGGAAASAGTHLNGRAVDLAPWDSQRKAHAMRKVGFAAWERAELPGVWGPHVHGINVFEARSNARGLAGSGFRQIASYDGGRDGLASNRTDPDSWRPSPLSVFTLQAYEHIMSTVGLEGGPMLKPNTITRARDSLVAADADLGRAVALLKKTPEEREAARAEIDDLQKERKHIRAVLERMPKR